MKSTDGCLIGMRSGFGWHETRGYAGCLLLRFFPTESLKIVVTQIDRACRQATIVAMSTAAIAARRALQQQRARFLYRKTLRNVLSWAVHRDIFYVEAQKVREKFESNKDVANLETIDRLLYEGETRVDKFQHPDPYIVPWTPGGSKWARNPPVPQEIGLVMDFGREENH